MTAKIGELNGKWSILLRVGLALNAVLIVPIVGWATFITLSIFELKQHQALGNQRIEQFMAQGERYTLADSNRDTAILRAEITVQLVEIKSSIQVLQRRFDELEKKIMP